VNFSHRSTYWKFTNTKKMTRSDVMVFGLAATTSDGDFENAEIQYKVVTNSVTGTLKTLRGETVPLLTVTVN
jgi:hypothetical protein